MLSKLPAIYCNFLMPGNGTECHYMLAAILSHTIYIGMVPYYVAYTYNFQISKRNEENTYFEYKLITISKT